MTVASTLGSSGNEWTCEKQSLLQWTWLWRFWLTFGDDEGEEQLHSVSSIHNLHQGLPRKSIPSTSLITITTHDSLLNIKQMPCPRGLKQRLLECCFTPAKDVLARLCNAGQHRVGLWEMFERFWQILNIVRPWMEPTLSHAKNHQCKMFTSFRATDRTGGWLCCSYSWLQARIHGLQTSTQKREHLQFSNENPISISHHTYDAVCSPNLPLRHLRECSESRMQKPLKRCTLDVQMCLRIPELQWSQYVFGKAICIM